jgi:hypothetical protein
MEKVAWLAMIAVCLVTAACGGGEGEARAQAARSFTPTLDAGSEGGGEPDTRRIPRISISGQPQSAVVVSGQPATFAVAASGSRPLMYQWYIDDVKISGAMSSTHTTRPLSLGDTGSVFSVVVSDGMDSVTSAGATVTVRSRETGVTPPVIISPPRRQSVMAGQSATFFAAVESSQTPTYQWRRNGIAIPKAVTASYTTPPTTLDDNGDRFSVHVGSGAGSTISADAVLTVTAPPADVANAP